jgi:predicted PurR-regulated permease PerM
VVLATLLSALMQGALAGAGFWVAGISSVAFLTLITVVFAMVPFVGAVAAWVPVCLWLFVMEKDQTKTATLLAIYCTVIVSQADNVVKPLILQGKSKLHPLLALLSILGGVQALGPIGILIGPMVVVFLQTLLNILNHELTSEAKIAAEGNETMMESKPETKPTPLPAPEKRHEKKGKRR